MLVADLLGVLGRLAPFSLAEPGDNCGLLVGDERAAVCRVLLSLELNEDVLEEALTGGFDTVLIHHPFLFSPVRSLVESRPRERLLRRLVAEHVSVIACHTNLDAAPAGLADIAGEALGLREMAPLQPASAGWCKFVGFIPEDSVEKVASAVFSAGAGQIGEYAGCAFAATGTGWFTAMEGAHPTIGQTGRAERVAEVRWETVVPRGLVGASIRAFVEAHPYEEPAFDICPVEDVLPRAGLGRVGVLDEPESVKMLGERAVATFELSDASWSGDGSRQVRRVGVLPGSGRSLVDAAAAHCEVLLTGDLGYHGAESAAEKGLALIDLPHGEFEWWTFRRWGDRLRRELGGAGITLAVSERWASPWTRHGVRCCASPATPTDEGRLLRVWIDGGSRGNPGPSAIGVVIEDASGAVLQTVGEAIGAATNNVAEYRALLTALQRAEQMEARGVEVFSDSELLVKQITGEYRVKNEGLKPLHEEARRRAGAFPGFSIRHVGRDENSRADALVNRALDEEERTGL